MMQQKIRKPTRQEWRVSWLALSCLSLYALVFRLAWNTTYLPCVIVAPLMAIGWAYMQEMVKKANERDKPKR